jgi:outer membrane immunogenic protein
MRKFVLPLIASLACATPALASDTRVEVRGGAIGSNGVTKATYGAAAGVDFDLAPLTFAGVEVSADKIDQAGTKVAYGVTGRFGVKAGPLTRLFVAGGYSTKPCDLCKGSWHTGAGIEQSTIGPLYLKAEYRHFFTRNGGPASNSVVGGVGMSF